MRYQCEVSNSVSVRRKQMQPPVQDAVARGAGARLCPAVFWNPRRSPWGCLMSSSPCEPPRARTPGTELSFRDVCFGVCVFNFWHECVWTAESTENHCENSHVAGPAAVLFTDVRFTCFLIDLEANYTLPCLMDTFFVLNCLLNFAWAKCWMWSIIYNIKYNTSVLDPTFLVYPNPHPFCAEPPCLQILEPWAMWGCYLQWLFRWRF